MQLRIADQQPVLSCSTSKGSAAQDGTVLSRSIVRVRARLSLPRGCTLPEEWHDDCLDSDPNPWRQTGRPLTVMSRTTNSESPSLSGRPVLRAPRGGEAPVDHLIPPPPGYFQLSTRLRMTRISQRRACASNRSLGVEPLWWNPRCCTQRCTIMALCEVAFQGVILHRRQPLCCCREDCAAERPPG